MSTRADENVRPAADTELLDIADYVADFVVDSDLALETARYCLMDSIGCAMLALRYTDCTRHLGPLIPGTIVPGGVRVPGTSFELDPVKAAFDTGMLVRWLDFNDTWLAEEWGHPSDNLGAILSVADYARRDGSSPDRAAFSIRDVLHAMIKAHEVQGVLALANSFNRVGLDHVILVKIASTAVATWMLGGSKRQIADALSHAWVDGQSLRTYRHAPNTVSRKSWAAGDATSRGLFLALMTLRGEPGLASPLTAPKWGFCDVLFHGEPLQRPQAYGTFVMENILFKIAFPAEFHAQTAIESAFALHDQVKHRFDEIDRIELSTQESAIRIISKTGKLYNHADRDHCLQYMVAVALIHGVLTAEHYSDQTAADPRIDELRNKMKVVHDPHYTRDYLDPQIRSIANAVQVFFTDGSHTEKMEVEFPLGHPRRRTEAIPVLCEKFRANLSTHFPSEQVEAIYETCLDHERLQATPVSEFIEMLTIPG